MSRSITWVVILCCALIQFTWLSQALAGGNYQIEINKKTNRLILYKDGVVNKTYPVATGKEDNLTPEGTFPIIIKIIQPGWKKIAGGSPKNPLGDRWLGIQVNNDKGRQYGIHGTNQPSSIGKHASAGCIRMYNKHVKELYHIVNEGTLVWIHKGPSNRQWRGIIPPAPQQLTGQVRVSVNVANVRKGPSMTADVLTRVKTGALFPVTEKRQEWYKITLPNKQVAFIHQSTVIYIASPTPTPVIEPLTGYAMVSVDVANVRKGPSMTADILQSAKVDTLFPVTGKQQEWYRITLPNQQVGFVHQSTVIYIASPTPTPVIEPLTGYAMVSVDVANVRKGPSMTADILQSAKVDTLFPVTGKQQEWYRITLPNQQVGFVHQSTVIHVPRVPGDGDVDDGSSDGGSDDANDSADNGTSDDANDSADNGTSDDANDSADNGTSDDANDSADNGTSDDANDSADNGTSDDANDSADNGTSDDGNITTISTQT